MESWVSTELTNKANRVLDKSILRGAFTNSYGLKGVITSSDTIGKTATLSAITINDLHGMVDAIIPELQPNCVFVINPGTWSQLKGSFLDVDNVNNQLITDGSNKTLLGYPVKVSTALLASTPIVFGDFSQYQIGVNRTLSIEVDRSVAFLTDSTALKCSMRLAGGPACSVKSIDSVSYGAFSKLSAA
jgi:HK97 family phage major capsid protein